MNPLGPRYQLIACLSFQILKYHGQYLLGVFDLQQHTSICTNAKCPLHIVGTTHIPLHTVHLDEMVFGKIFVEICFVGWKSFRLSAA